MHQFEQSVTIYSTKTLTKRLTTESVMPELNPQTYPAVSLIKRLMAILYDSFLLLAIFFITGIPVSTLTTFILNDGNAITDTHPYYLLNQALIILTLFLSSIFFLGWFWTHGGQTLGMKTWKIQLISNSLSSFSWRQALIRYFVALISWLILGCGFLWTLIDKKKRSWHDIASSSQLVHIDRK